MGTCKSIELNLFKVVKLLLFGRLDQWIGTLHTSHFNISGRLHLRGKLASSLAHLTALLAALIVRELVASNHRAHQGFGNVVLIGSSLYVQLVSGSSNFQKESVNFVFLGNHRLLLELALQILELLHSLVFLCFVGLVLALDLLHDQ